jgi:hypothetical protein
VIDHVPKRLTGRTASGFHICPDIPAKMVSGATSAYARLGQDERILVLFDNTLMGSAKSGIVLTDRRIYWNGGSDAHNACYEELEDVRFEKMKLYIRLRGRDYLLTFPDMTQLSAKDAQPFGEVLQEVFNKVRNECVPPPESGERDEGFGPLGSVLVRTLRLGHCGQFFITPDIPDKKLANACATYARPRDGERYLALFDDTTFGSAKAGFCVTDCRIVWTDSRDVREISWVELTNLDLAECTDRKLTLRLGGNHYVLSIAMWNNKNMGALALALSRVARQVCEKHGQPTPVGVAHLDRISQDCGIDDQGSTRVSQKTKVEETCQHVAKPVQCMEDAIRDAFGSGIDSVYVQPDIPDKKLANAMASYATLEPGERMLALFDDTVLGSAKNGFCLTDRRLIWKGMSRRGALSYDELPGTKKARPKAGELRIELARGMRRIELTIWKDEQIGFLLRVLCGAAELEARKTQAAGTVSPGLFALQQCHKLIAGQGRGCGAIQPAVAPSPDLVPLGLPVEMRGKIQRDLPQVLGEYTSDKLFACPNIPAIRLEGARAGYARLQPDELVLALFDSTLAQTGATGFCLTDLRVVWHELGQGHSVAYSDILDVRHGGDKLCLVTAQGDHILALGELDSLQVDGVMTALLRIGSIVFSHGWMIRRITRAVLLDVGGDPKQETGTLGLSDKSIVWVPDERKAGMDLSLRNITNLWPSMDQKKLSFKEQGTRCEFYVQEAASRWVQHIEEAMGDTVAKTAVEAPVAVAVVASETPPHVADLILAAMKPRMAGNLSIAPAFDEKKLNNAKKAYLQLDAHEQLLVLFDDTFWGSAKRGFAMTDRRLIWNDGSMQPKVIAYHEIRDVCHEGAIVLFILVNDLFQGFSMDSLDKELAGAMGVLFCRLADVCRKQQGASSEQEFRFLRTGLLSLTEVDGKEIERTKGLLCLTSRVLIWIDDNSGQFGIPLYDIHSCSKALMGQTFWVKRHARKSGLLGALGIGGHASLGWKASGDAQHWIAAIEQAVAGLPPAEIKPPADM